MRGRGRRRAPWTEIDACGDLGARLIASRRGIADYRQQLTALEFATLSELVALGLPDRRSRWAVNAEFTAYVELRGDEVAQPGWSECRFCPAILEAFHPPDAAGPIKAFMGTQLYLVLEIIAKMRKSIEEDIGCLSAQLASELEHKLAEFSGVSLNHDEHVGRKCRIAAPTGAQFRDRSEAKDRNARWREIAKSKQHWTIPQVARHIAQKEGVKVRTVSSVLYGERGVPK